MKKMLALFLGLGLALGASVAEATPLPQTTIYAQIGAIAPCVDLDQAPAVCVNVYHAAVVLDSSGPIPVVTVLTPSLNTQSVVDPLTGANENLTVVTVTAPGVGVRAAVFAALRAIYAFSGTRKTTFVQVDQ